jgi:hypothetical protein
VTKLAAGLLPVSVLLYVASLTMYVARVTGHVTLDAAAIESAIETQVGSTATLDKVSDEITAVISGVVRDEFPMFANRFVLDRIGAGVDQQVRQRGPAMIGELLPAFDVPQPEPEVRRLRLLETIRDLWRDGDAFLAVCLVMFTIFFPITKYVALTALLVDRVGPEGRARVLAWLKSWGQWSMGDVFVVAFLVVYLRINTSVVSTGGELARIAVRVDVEPGMYVFAASVVSAMICSMLLTAAERSTPPETQPPAR